MKRRWAGIAIVVQASAIGLVLCARAIALEGSLILEAPAWSPDGKYVLFNNWEQFVVWDPASGTNILAVEGYGVAAWFNRRLVITVGNGQRSYEWFTLFDVGGNIVAQEDADFARRYFADARNARVYYDALEGGFVAWRKGGVPTLAEWIGVGQRREVPADWRSVLPLDNHYAGTPVSLHPTRSVALWLDHADWNLRLLRLADIPTELARFAGGAGAASGFGWVEDGGAIAFAEPQELDSVTKRFSSFRVVLMDPALTHTTFRGPLIELPGLIGRAAIAYHLHQDVLACLISPHRVDEGRQSLFLVDWRTGRVKSDGMPIPAERVAQPVWSPNGPHLALETGDGALVLTFDTSNWQSPPQVQGYSTMPDSDAKWLDEATRLIRGAASEHVP